jgi:hypothetical protein
MAYLWMIFPAINLHLFTGFSMAMLNNHHGYIKIGSMMIHHFPGPINDGHAAKKGNLFPPYSETQKDRWIHLFTERLVRWW